MNNDHYIRDELETLRKRTQWLDIVALEYLRVDQLIDHAARDADLVQYAATAGLEIGLIEKLADEHTNNRLNAQNNLLYVDPKTGMMVDVNDTASDFLGYSRDELLNLAITDLEIPGEGSTTTLRTYVETSIEEQVYRAVYRHRSGHELLVHVYKRLLHKGDRAVLVYRLEDRSLHRRLWYELQRRERNNFNFQHKLQILNEITIELSQAVDRDMLCRQAVQSGMEQLGFDRMGIWFLDREHSMMTGAYGVDEQGNIRDEYGQRWSYTDTYVAEFLAGKTDVVFAYDESPLYNDRSEIIDYGWHIAAPLLNKDTVVGVMMADNYLSQQPIRDYQMELLRQYAVIIGRLSALIKVAR